ncbi:MAG: hypothetical protein KF774_06560 [Planctomyces sp.]|nr:hypothetical protein [Planctomyces sp.]
MYSPRSQSARQRRRRVLSRNSAAGAPTDEAQPDDSLIHSYDDDVDEDSLDSPDAEEHSELEPAPAERAEAASSVEAYAPPPSIAAATPPASRIAPAAPGADGPPPKSKTPPARTCVPAAEELPRGRPAPERPRDVLCDLAWMPLARRLLESRPIVWTISGYRPPSPELGGRLVGDWFSDLWRTGSDRQGDIVIDSTWPGALLSGTHNRFGDRVLRFQPEVAVLLFGDRDSGHGLPGLTRFERQLSAMLVALRNQGATPLLVPPPDDGLTTDEPIDRLVYREAIVGIAKERDALVLEPERQSAADGEPDWSRQAAEALAGRLLECIELLRAGISQ